MVVHKCFAILTFILFGAFMGSPSNDSEFPKDYFRLPVNRSIKLSGTFGELRPNHFHAGIDIKSLNGTSGEPLYAAAEGYVSRIKVQAFSYGRALYIDHPNGYTTVYAHLDAFNEELEAYIRKKQYQHQKFSVDLYPDPAAFQLKQGEFIGKLGNSGNSFGPHLHFEIRQTADQVPVNPMLFDLPIEDNTAPDIYELVVYTLNDKHEVMDRTFHPVIHVEKGIYRLSKPLKESAWRVAFGLKTYDRMDGTSNKNGIYKLAMKVDDQPAYGFQMDAIPFDKTRYLNAHLDYALKQNKKGYVNRCFKLPGNNLDIYGPPEETGITPLYQDKTRKVEMIVTDTDNNESLFSFEILRAEEMDTPERENYHYAIQYDQPFELDQSSISIQMDAGTFYETTYLQFSSEEKSEAFPFGIYSLGKEDIPVHKYFNLSLNASEIPASKRKKAFVAYIGESGKIINNGGKWNQDQLKTRVRSLGRYTILFDEQPPKVTAISFRENMENWKEMSFTIKDNFRTGGSAKGLKYEAFVDGDWILMEYDGKRDLITHKFNGQIEPGEHTLKIIVEDDRGNVGTFKRRFSI